MIEWCREFAGKLLLFANVIELEIDHSLEAWYQWGFMVEEIEKLEKEMMPPPPKNQKNIKCFVLTRKTLTREEKQNVADELDFMSELNVLPIAYPFVTFHTCERCEKINLAWYVPLGDNFSPCPDAWCAYPFADKDCVEMQCLCPQCLVEVE